MGSLFPPGHDRYLIMFQDSNVFEFTNFPFKAKYNNSNNNNNNNSNNNKNNTVVYSVNPIQDGGLGAKRPPTSFSPVTSTNVEFGPQNFLTFSFNPFATLVQNFKFVPSASPKLLNLNQDHPSKKSDFSGQIILKLRL